MVASCRQLGQSLEDLSTRIQADPALETWEQVQSVAHNLANGLRVRDGPEDNHTILGLTTLPQVIAKLLELALHGAIPDTEHAPIAFELLRVAANLCMDHDENRNHLLEAGLPQVIVALLEDYTKTIPNDLGAQPLPLSISHLKVVKTSIGVLLNASIGFDPVKFRLISLESVATIVKLRAAIYPPSSWLKADTEITPESWELRCGLYNWASRTISELKDVKDESLQILGQSALPFLTPPLLAFCPPFPPQSNTIPADSELYETLLETDLEVLEESCMLIESLSLDVEDVRLVLARGFLFPAEHDGVPCFRTMLDFIEKGEYPPYWNDLEQSELKRRTRAFDICKAAVIKAVVEVAGEKGNADVLWDDSEPDSPGGAFVCRMVTWIKQYVLEQDTNAVSTVGRDDLVICASLSLGNLSRRDKHATTLLSPPHSLAPILTSPHLLSATADIKVKHGVIGLLKHLAQYSPQTSLVRTALRDADVVRHITSSGVWDQKTDAMAEVVQAGAIGVAKHLCNGSLDNAIALTLSSPGISIPPGLAQILALVKRSESVPIKSEGTRVLVNVIKSVYSPTPSSGEEVVDDATLQLRQRNRQDCINAVLTVPCTEALAQLVGRSMKYPLLVNEGVVALSLLSNQKKGGPMVLEAILAPLPLEDIPTTASTSASASTSSGADSPSVATPSTRTRLPIQHRVLDMLVAALKNVDNPANFPPEVRANICVFLVQLGRYNPQEDLIPVKQVTRPILERIAGSRDLGGLLGAAAQKALDSYAQ